MFPCVGAFAPQGGQHGHPLAENANEGAFCPKKGLPGSPSSRNIPTPNGFARSTPLAVTSPVRDVTYSGKRSRNAARGGRPRRRLDRRLLGSLLRDLVGPLASGVLGRIDLLPSLAAQDADKAA